VREGLHFGTKLVRGAYMNAVRACAVGEGGTQTRVVGARAHMHTHMARTRKRDTWRAHTHAHGARAGAGGRGARGPPVPHPARRCGHAPLVRAPPTRPHSV
jgi:hypothetical protein